MSSPGTNKNAVLVATDGSPGALMAARWVRLNLSRDDWRAHLLTVVDPVPWGGATGGLSYAAPATLSEPDVARIQQAALEDTAAELNGFDISQEALSGDPVHVILERVRVERPALVVVGHRGLRGLPGFLLGSVAKELVMHAMVPTVVVPLHGI